MKKIFLCVILWASIGPAAADKSSPVELFRSVANYQLLICRIETSTALMQVETGTISEPWAKINDCIKKARADVKKSFSPALATVAKKPAAAKMLKDYYAVWLTALSGISPTVNERKISYDQRQDAADLKEEEAWNRFEVEAGM